MLARFRCVDALFGAGAPSSLCRANFCDICQIGNAIRGIEQGHRRIVPGRPRIRMPLPLVRQLP